MTTVSRRASLKQRIGAGEVLIGTFLKTPAPHVVELLDLAGLDFAVPDQEHAPIGIETLDVMAATARGLDFPLLVRVPQAEALAISRPLDLGAAGVMVPHVSDPATAARVVAATRHLGGSRGFSPSGRAGDYGTVPAPEQRQRALAETVVLAQIEDAGALEHIDAIAATAGLDVLFIGPADLALSLGSPSPETSEMKAAVDRVLEAGARHGVAVGIAVGAPEQVQSAVDRGLRVIVAGSDQSALLAGARRLSSLRPTQPPA